MMKTKSLALVAAGAMLVMLAIAQSGGILLRRELKENASDSYKLKIVANQTIDMGGMQMPIDVTTTADLGLNTLKVSNEKKEADLEVKLTNLKLDMGDMAGMGGMMPELPKEVVSTGVIDARNRIKMNPPKPSGGQQGNMMAMVGMMSGGFGDPVGILSFEFPEKALAVGESWEVVLPKNPMTGNTETKLNAKLVAEKDHNGVAAYEILISGKVPYKVDTAELAKSNPDVAGAFGGMAMLISGSADISTSAIVAKGSGKTLAIDSTVKSNSVVEMPSQGMTLNTSGTVKTTLTKQ